MMCLRVIVIAIVAATGRSSRRSNRQQQEEEQDVENAGRLLHMMQSVVTWELDVEDAGREGGCSM